MKFNNALAAIVTIALTAGINVSAMANITPDQEVKKENNELYYSIDKINKFISKISFF